MISASFPALLQSFFTDRLLRQRAASPHTIAGYRDCFRLLLQVAKEQLAKCLLNSRSRIWMHLSLSYSSNTWNVLAKTALVLGMPGWQQSTRSSGMSHWRSPHMRYIGHRILARAQQALRTTADRVSEIEKKSMPCSPFRILLAGSDAEIELWSWSRLKRVCGYPS